MTRITRRYLDGRWGQVHVTHAGSGAPVLLLHQSPLSGTQFLPVLPLLAAAGFQAVALDTAGFGMSDPPPAPASIADHAENVATVLDGLGWASCAVVGHHTGAAIAASLAAVQPDRVSRLVLNGVPLFSPEELAFFRSFQFGPLEPQPDGSHLAAAWAQRVKATPGWTDLEAMHRHVVAMLAVHRRYHWGFLAALDHDVTPDLLAIRVPTLLFTNTGEDLYAATQRAHRLRPDFGYAELVGGTHDIIDEQPDAWAKGVIGFLRDRP
jgi:pimeloyl-ACP methyl ester carboxylesterase